MIAPSAYEIDNERVKDMNHGAAKTILLVEDQAIIAMMEKKELEKYGYAVHHVVKGEDAVKVVLENAFPVDLILMDIDLGSGIDGTQAAEMILQHIEIPVVFLSSHTEKTVVEKTEKITSYGYVVKNSGIVVLDTSIKMAFKLFEANKKITNELAERKRAEEKIQELDIRMRKLFENVPDLIYQFTRKPDGSYCVPIASKGVMKIFGCSPEDVRDSFEPISRVLHPDDTARVIEAIEHSAQSLSYFTCEFRVNIPGRNIQWIFSRSTPERLPDGSITWYGFNVDITESKNAERHRQAEEDNLRITLNSIGDAVISTDDQGNIVRMNPVAESLCGWKEEEARGKNLDEVFHIVNAGTRERLATPLKLVMSTGKAVGLANHTMLISKDGKEYQIADSAAPILTSEGEISGVVLVFRDVTAQYEKDRQLEERLKELNCLYAISEIVGKPDIPLSDILQQTAEVLPGSWQHPHLSEARITLDKQVFQTSNFSLTKWSLGSTVCVDGKERGDITVCYSEPRPVRDEGSFLKEERKLLDAVAERLGRIIERKELEEKLHSIEWMLTDNKEKKRRFIPEYGDVAELNKDGLILTSLGRDKLLQISSEYLDLLDTSSAVYEKNGDYAMGIFSSGWCQLMDAASRRLCGTNDNKEAIGSGKWLCHESCWRDASRIAIAEDRPVDIECAGGIRIYALPVHLNGEVIGAINFGYGNPPEDDSTLQRLSELYKIPLEVLRKKSEEYKTRPQFIIDYAKKRIKIAAQVIESLVERKQVENELRKNEHGILIQKQYLEKILETSSDGFWVVGPDKKITDVNTAYCRMTGYTREELEVMKINDLDAVESPVESEERMKKIIKNGSDIFETKHRCKDGSLIDVELSVSFLERSDGMCFVCFCRDITDRKKIETELAESAERFEALHNASFGGIAIHDKGIILECNQGLSEMSGYSVSELIGMDGLLLIAPDDRDMVMSKILSGFEKPYEAKGIRKGGEIFPIRLEARNVPYKGRNVRTVEFRDITESKRAEEEIQRQLTEKEILLREVHHRVKNNIATIEGLLSLQADTMVNNEVKTALHDAVSRVQSMRVLYEKLLLSKDLDTISMKNYAENLIESLVKFFNPDNRINIRTQYTDFMVDAKKAVSIGIIINELLTNAFKYAFTDRGTGTVSVSMEKEGHKAIIIIQDDGIGIDERIVHNTSPGFGLTVVKMLVEQLNGTYNMINEKGTKSVLQFEI